MHGNNRTVLRQIRYRLLRSMWAVSLGMVISGGLLGGYEGLGIVLGVLALTWLVFLFQHRIVHLPHASAAVLLSVRELSQRLGLAAPEVYEFGDPRAGASAMSGIYDGSAAVVVTSGLCRLPKGEVDAAIAHEMAHIKNRDPQVIMGMFTAVGLVGGHVALGIVDTWAMAVVGLLPLMAWVQELRADALAARAIGDPVTMSKALQRHKSYNVLIDLPLWLSVALLTLLYSNTLPLLPLFLLSYAAARMLPDHPPTFLRTWLLCRGWSIPSARSRHAGSLGA